MIVSSEIDVLAWKRSDCHLYGDIAPHWMKNVQDKKDIHCNSNADEVGMSYINIENPPRLASKAYITLYLLIRV
jgi:hypothetical protein